MSKRRRAQQEALEPEQSQPQADDRDAWDAPAFLRSRLISLGFVLAPAIVMAVLGELRIAAAWAAVGVSIIVFDSRRQLRDFWRSLRSG